MKVEGVGGEGVGGEGVGGEGRVEHHGPHRVRHAGAEP